MKLFYSTSSPYVRKARVTAREKGLMAWITEIECNPFADPPELRRLNRIGKVPTLVLEDGSALYDSPVICEYLDGLAKSPKLIPTIGNDRWKVLRAHALADGILDLGVLLTLEGRRPSQEHSSPLVTRWQNQIRGALGVMGEEFSALPREITIGHIAFASALSYLDFRWPDIGWRDLVDPALKRWYEEFAARPAMTQTALSDHSYSLRA